jgi:hypothetical protein
MAFVVPRVRDDGSLATLALGNASIARQDPVEVFLRGVDERVTKAVWHEPEHAPVELPVVRDGAFVRVRLPRLAAWSCGYLDVTGTLPASHGAREALFEVEMTDIAD